MTAIITGVTPNRISVHLSDEFEISESEDDDLSSVSDDSISIKEEVRYTTEIEQLHRAINDTITNLFHLSMAIRRPTPRGRYAASTNAPSFDAIYDIAHVRHKFKYIQDQTWLVERLGKAITRRREYFRYRREHRRKLDLEYSQSSGGKRGKADFGVKVSTSENQPDTPDKGPPTLAQTKATTFVPTTPTQAVPFDQEEQVSITSYATSVEEDSKHALRVPNPPQFVGGGIPFEYGVPFECPYCFTIQSVRNLRDWKYVIEVSFNIII